MRRYVLLDRDGVINRRLRNGYVTSWPQFEFLPGVFEALRLLKANHYRALVISNQAAVGKNLMTEAQLSEITSRFIQQVAKSGGQIHGVYYCPHAPEQECTCRKPQPGLLLKAQREHRFSFHETYLIGDSESDVLAAQSVGCPFIRVLNFEADTNSPFTHLLEPVFPSLLEAVDFLLKSSNAAYNRAEIPS
jgi:histidinol-phosphate phosphatase family protein